MPAFQTTSKTVLLCVLALWLTACASAPPVAVDYDPQADFSGFKSYFLLDALAIGPVAPLEMKRARQSLDGVLRTHYLPAASRDEADFLVRVQIVASDKVAVYQDSLGLYGSGYYWGWGVRAPLTVREYREMSLVVDVLSPSNAPLWRGSLVSDAQRAGSPEQQQQRLREEATQILSRFPPHLRLRDRG
ncbi:DUF4136 domain-containing protein [Microbulbifer sp. TYP-18]|uniref:DUF4136 domain-containing protein n=1 Tax=Microbulbifer sp. TYP-18 TaxID=3230024 RepID=UPI0034C67508